MPSTLFVVACVLVTAANVHAQGRVHERALDAFEASEAAYARGDLAESARQLREAYALEPTSVLLYNLGRVCERMGDAVCALDAYRSYLDQDVDGADRASVQLRIDALAPPTVAPVVTVDSGRAPPAAPDVLPGALLVSGGGLLVLGAIAMGIASVVLNDHALAMTTPLLDAVSAERARDGLTIAWPITLVVGLLLAAGGGSWLGIELARPSTGDVACRDLALHF